MAKQFKTIEEMEKAYYTEPLKVIAETQGITVEELVQKTKSKAEALNGLTPDEIAKAAPFITTTTGALNYVYGGSLWSSIVTEANAFGILPKKPYDKGGYRAITAAASTSSAGTSEAGPVPASLKPTLAAVDVGLKTLSATTEISEVLSLMEGKDDVASWGELLGYAKDEFINRVNRGLLNGIVTGKQIGRASCRERVLRLV